MSTTSTNFGLDTSGMARRHAQEAVGDRPDRPEGAVRFLDGEDAWIGNGTRPGRATRPAERRALARVEHALFGLILGAVVSLWMLQTAATRGPLPEQPVAATAPVYTCGAERAGLLAASRQTDRARTSGL